MERLEIELCGPLADLAGPVLALDIPPEGLGGEELLAQVAAASPALGAQIARGRVKLCVNEVMASQDTIVRPGDVAALFPPVSGG